MQTTLTFWYRLILMCLFSEFEHVKQRAADNEMITIFLKPRNLFSSVQV